jgi:hypothetical protein
MLNNGPQYLSHYLFYTKKCNKLNVGGEVVNFLDEGGGILKTKVLRLGAALKNVQYLVFITHRPPPLPLLMTGP